MSGAPSLPGCESMRAWRLNAFAGIASMTIEQTRIPRPRAGEVLVRLHAAAANPFDWYMADGLLAMFEISLPATFGRDGAGIVEALGEGVTGFQVGDAVYGQADPEDDGTFADYATLRADRLLRKPGWMSFAAAAALPNAIYAAWNALFSPVSGVNLQAGQTVLVHGAGGGIGSLVVQLAKWRGAHVTAVASSRHEALMRELGVDRFIDYTRQEFDEEIRSHIDGVVDTICAEPAARSFAILKPGGSYVSLLKTPDQVQAKAAGIRAVLAFGPNSYDATLEIEALVASGAIRPVISKILPFVEAPAALFELKAGHVQGKIVLDIIGSGRAE